MFIHAFKNITEKNEFVDIYLPAPAWVLMCVLLLLCFYFFVQKQIICHKILQFIM